MLTSCRQGNLNVTSLPVKIRFEDCHVEGVGFKPYGTVVSCGYYFNSFGATKRAPLFGAILY